MPRRWRCQCKYRSLFVSLALLSSSPSLCPLPFPRSRAGTDVGAAVAAHADARLLGALLLSGLIFGSGAAEAAAARSRDDDGGARVSVWDWARRWAQSMGSPVGFGFFFVFFQTINRGGRCNVLAVVKVYLPRRARYTARRGKSVNRGGQGRPPRLSHDLPWPLGRGGWLCPPRKTENARLQ